MATRKKSKSVAKSNGLRRPDTPMEELAWISRRRAHGKRRPRSVLQDWVHGLPFMQQSVLIAAVRGPDGIRKDHPVKVLCRWLRRSVLISSFEGRPLLDPYEPGGGSFTGPCQSAEVRNLPHAMDLYFRLVDELPHHFQLHLMHAAEILGYKHPEKRIRNWWRIFYEQIVRDAHLQPESEAEMDERLSDSEAAWRARETVTAY